MRVLVSVNDAVGHVLPLLPLVRALSAAGHEVLLASPGPRAGSLVDLDGVTAVAVEATGLTAQLEPQPPRGDHVGRLAWAVQRSWPNDARAWAGPLLELARGWRPDLVVVEPVEHAGRVVAAALGVPMVEHGWGFSLPAGSDSAGTAGILDLYDSLQATPVEPALRVDVGPSSWQGDDVTADVERYRVQPWSPKAPPLPPPSDRPRVLVTLGTYDNQHAADRLREAVAGAATLPVEVVVALGNSDRGGVLGFPQGVVATEWVDLPSEVRRCAAVVHHAGAGSTLATACAGVPAVCLPQGADQFRNSALLARVGAGVVVGLDGFEPALVAAALQEVLQRREIRAAAERLAGENEALPPVEHTVSRLSELVS